MTFLELHNVLGPAANLKGLLARIVPKLGKCLRGGVGNRGETTGEEMDFCRNRPRRTRPDSNLEFRDLESDNSTENITAFEVSMNGLGAQEDRKSAL